MSHKYVYLFTEGNGSMRELLGGKGANLAEMTSLGMPVPQGFTISTEACTKYYEDGRSINDEIMGQVYEALAKIEAINDKKFGDPQKPLLVSVRSGARASMPGMMDTILNLGMNDEVAAGLIAGNPTDKFERFVYDSYRRFIQMFSDVVMELSKKRFEVIIDEVKAAKGVKDDIDLDKDDMKELVARFKEFYKQEKGGGLPHRSQGPDGGGHQGRLPLLGQSPRQLLPPHERHPLFLGHRRQRHAHGLRQPEREFRHRRGLHPEPRHR